MNNDKIFQKLKMKIAISNAKNEEDIEMSKFGIKRGIGIAVCVLVSTTGVVFAGNKIIEKIWKEPKKVQTITSNITEESKKENITEEEAKEIAINKLKEIGFNSNIVETNHVKEIDSNKIYYRFITEDNYQINIDGLKGEFFDIWNENQNIQDKSIEITEEEAIEKAGEYCKLFGYDLKNYELTRVLSNNNEGSRNGPGYLLDIEYSKKYGDVCNPFETISLAIESKDKNLEYFRVDDNTPFDNNETIITKDEAIQIALDEDKKIETNKIVQTKAEKRIVKMNANAYYRIKDPEKFYKEVQTVESELEDRNYYEVENRARNAWVVVITYEDNFGDDVVRRYTEMQYSYFVDCTTGEIIGGALMDYIVSD